MALVLADRVRETTTTTGTGSVTLAGAVTGFQSFISAMAVGDTTYYTIAGQGNNEWEVGIGTLTNSTTLARTTILDTSNNNTSPVNFSAGGKDVFITYPAIEAVPKSFLDGAYETVSTNPSANVFSSGSWAVSTNINSNENVNVGLTFSPDGLNMYTSGEVSNAIDQYSLTRAFDVTSISYVRTFSVSAQTTEPRGITFDPTGIYMYVGDDLNNRVIRYVLGTAWDISTAGTPTSFSVAGQITVLGFSIQFRPNGLEMFVCNQTSTVVTYTLSVAWDITTAGLTRVNNFESNLRGFVFSNDGLRLFTLDSVGVVRRRSPATAWNTNGIGGAGTADQTVTFAATNFPIATYSFPSFTLYLNEAVTGISAGIRMFTVLPGAAGLFEYIGQFQLGAVNDLSLMLIPLFDITTTTSRQVNLDPGPFSNYIGRFGVPSLDFGGMTKQIKIAAPTIIFNNGASISPPAGSIISPAFASLSLDTNNILQATYTGSVWEVTDLDNSLKNSFYNLQNQSSGVVAYNSTLNSLTPRTLGVSASFGTYGINGFAGWSNPTGASGNPTLNLVVANIGIVRANSRERTIQFNTWQKPQYWNIYGEGYGYSPWNNAGTTNNGTLFNLQKGGGFNNTDTPDNYYWDRNNNLNVDANYIGIPVGFPRPANDRNSFLRNFYYIGDQTNGGRWYQRELLSMAETNFPTTARSVRSTSELVLGLNYVDPTEDTFADGNSYNYAVAFAGDASQNPTGTRVTGQFLITGTIATPTIQSVSVVATSEVYIRINGERYHLSYWSADNTVSGTITGGGYTAQEATLTFGGTTTLYYNYWTEGDVSSRTFVHVYNNNTATTYWTWQLGEDRGGTVWRVYALSANRASWVGGIPFVDTGSGGAIEFPSGRLQRVWSLKSMALPLTTDSKARGFSIQARFRVDDITTANQNVFWVANGAAAANGIKVIVNEGSVDRRLSVTLATTAPAAIVTSLRVWQFNDINEWITLTWTWNPLDTTFPGRLYCNGVMCFKTASNPFGAATAWWNIGSTVNGTANGFIGYFNYLTCVPEVWGAYIPQGTALIDVDAGDPAWVAAGNNGGAVVNYSNRNNYGFRGYLRGSSWGIGANIRSDFNEYFDGPVVGSAAESFTINGDTVSGDPTITLSRTTSGFNRNPGYFLITGTGIPTTTGTNIYVGYVPFGAKSFAIFDRNGFVNATTTANGTAFTLIRISGTTSQSYLEMPGNAINVTKSNAPASVIFTNELAGWNGSADTATSAFPSITFTATADATINDYYTTQNSAGNNTAVRNIQNALAIGKVYTASGSGLTATSATIDNARVVSVAWDNFGTGLHYIQLSRNRDAAVAAGATISLRFVPNPSCTFYDFELLGGDSAKTNDDSVEMYGYSPNPDWFSSSLGGGGGTGNAKAMMARAGIGQWRFIRIAPPGCIYDSGVFRAASTTFARKMYLGYGCIGYLITYGATGDYNLSTVNPVVSTIAWAASNGMNSDGFSLTVVAGTLYRVVILPFNPTLVGDYYNGQF